MTTEIKCPDCGNTDLSQMEWYELIPSYRPIHGVLPSARNPRLVLGDEGIEFWEGSEGGTIMCRKCDTEVPIPENLESDFMSKAEYEKLRD